MPKSFCTKTMTTTAGRCVLPTACRTSTTTASMTRCLRSGSAAAGATVRRRLLSRQLRHPRPRRIPVAAGDGDERQGIVGARIGLDAGWWRRLDRTIATTTATAATTTATAAMTPIGGAAAATGFRHPRGPLFGLQPVRRELCRRHGRCAQPRPRRLQRQGPLAADRVGLLAVLQRRRFPGQLPHLRPRRFPMLPSGQSHSISSGRQVSNNYPYRNNPKWGDNSSASSN